MADRSPQLPACREHRAAEAGPVTTARQESKSTKHRQGRGSGAQRQAGDRTEATPTGRRRKPGILTRTVTSARASTIREDAGDALPVPRVARRPRSPCRRSDHDQDPGTRTAGAIAAGGNSDRGDGQGWDVRGAGTGAQTGPTGHQRGVIARTTRQNDRRATGRRHDQDG
jgi:hypothetical protein